MNKKQILYYFHKYRPNFVPIAFYFFGFFIVLRILIPQFTQFQIVRNELQSVKDDIDLLESSLETVSNMDEAELDQTLEQLERALPFDQDATLIVASLNTAALRAGVELTGYVVNPGKIYEKEVESENSDQVSTEDKTPFQEIEVRIVAENINSLISFLGSLAKLAPISEITEFSAQNQNGNYNLKFFYKPLNRQDIANRNVVTPLKATDLEVIEMVKSLSF